MDFTIIKYNCRKNIRKKLFASFLIMMLRIAFCIFGGIVSGYSLRMNNRVHSIVINTAVLLTVLFVLSVTGYTSEMWHCRIGEKKRADEGVMLYCIFSQMHFKKIFLDFSVILRKIIYDLLLSLPGIALIFLSFFMYRSYGENGYLFSVTVISGVISLLTGLGFSFCIKQRYFLTKYLSMKYSDLTVNETVLLSSKIMDGRCFKTVIFKLSFIPQFALCLLILPSVYVIPYYRQSCVCLKRELIGSFCEGKLSE